MKNVEFDKTPYSYELFYKGSYKGNPFTVVDKDSEVYVNFDSHYPATSEEYNNVLDMVKKKYIKVHEKDRKWHK